FCAAMRSDLDAESPPGHPAAPEVRCLSAGEHADYVYGSAEVVGLMCLRIFLHDNPRDDTQLPTLECGARRLGAAFQNINFL
ncbi:squalene/phytoene synthase family protein, partial [Vibrio cholerae O1]|nr:squalene/phytoene synthase family protein [Vibrio cholerae O1]